MSTLANLLADDAWTTRPCAPPDDTDLIRGKADQWYPREMYYPAAKDQCDGCTIKTACLQFALDNNEEHGIWGGLTPQERQTLTRRNKREEGEVA